MAYILPASAPPIFRTRNTWQTTSTGYNLTDYPTSHTSPPHLLPSLTLPPPALLTFPNDPCPRTFSSSNWDGSALGTLVPCSTIVARLYSVSCSCGRKGYFDSLAYQPARHRRKGGALNTKINHRPQQYGLPRPRAACLSPFLRSAYDGVETAAIDLAPKQLGKLPALIVACQNRYY